MDNEPVYKWVKASEELPSIEQVRMNSAVMIVKINGFNATTMYDYKTGRFWITDPKQLQRGGAITFKHEEIEWLKEIKPVPVAETAKDIAYHAWTSEQAINQPFVAAQSTPVSGEWQLCPMCGGMGYTQPYLEGTVVTTECKVCNGAKIIARPVAAHEHEDSLIDEVMGVSARALEEKDKEIERLSNIIADYDTKEIPGKLKQAIEWCDEKIKYNTDKDFPMNNTFVAQGVANAYEEMKQYIQQLII